MANMLKGKFRDKIRLFLKNKNKKIDIKETKYTKNVSNSVSLSRSKVEFKSNDNIYNKLITRRQIKKVGMGTHFKKNNNEKIIVSSQLNGNKKECTNLEKEQNKKINENKASLLEEKIVTKIVEIVEEYKSELDIISSDIYIINLNSKDIKTKEQCQEEELKIKELIEKLNKIKEEFKILKSKNLSNEYIDINDWSLIDLISYYKSVLDTIPNTKKVEEDIKKMDGFEQANKLLDNLNEEIKLLDKSNNEKLSKENINIEKFNQIKNNSFNLNSEYSRYANFINEQTVLLEELNNKVGKINKTEQIKYNFVGYNQILFNVLKYASLLLLSPLKGIFPTIAVTTLATKNSLEMLGKEAHVEEIKKIKFSVEDFTNLIFSSISSINLVESMIEDSLKDVKNIRKKLNLISPNSIPMEYNSMINNLDEFENLLKGNKNKINKLKEKMEKNLAINKNTITKVKKLNEHT